MFNKKIILVLFTATLIITATIFYKSNHYKNEIPIVQPTQVPFNDILPGVTTEEDVIQNFGKPFASESGVLQYKSRNPSRNNIINIQDNKVHFFKEIITSKDKINLTEVFAKYGELKFLYGEDSINGYFLFYLPEKGLAYLANPNTGTILEVWHFPTTTFDIFKKTWAKDYSLNPIKNQY